MAIVEAAGSSRARVGLGVSRFRHAAMATQFEIRCTHADEHYARQAAFAAFHTVDRLEQQLSRFVETSDIARINALAAGEETKVSVETLECLLLARIAFDVTGGAFDASLGTGFDRLELDPGRFLVRATADGVRLDLGAIGKGYAVDRAAEVLEDWECGDALIDAGFSSVVALGPPAGGRAWPLTLSRPDGAGEVIAHIAARQMALGASGIRRGDHIRDPHTGAPVTARQAAWVSGSREALGAIGQPAGVFSPAAIGDALSTAFMVMPNESIDRYGWAHGVDVWIVEGDSVWTTTARNRP